MKLPLQLYSKPKCSLSPYTQFWNINNGDSRMGSFVLIFLFPTYIFKDSDRRLCFDNSNKDYLSVAQDWETKLYSVGWQVLSNINSRKIWQEYSM